MNRGMFNVWEHRCSESKSLVQGVEMSVVIGVVPGGLPQGTCSLAEVGGSELEAFFFFYIFEGGPTQSHSLSP